MNTKLKWTVAGLGVVVVIGGGYMLSSTQGHSQHLAHSGSNQSNSSTTSAQPAPFKEFQENGKTVKEFELVAKTASFELKDGVKFEAFTYNGSVPGTQIRVKEGDQVRIKFKNELQEATSVHWHGIPVPNPMDGVAGVTQNALKTGETFTYEFPATVPGTYMYHSHQNSADQIDKGLYGTLIVEPRSAEVKYDRDFTLVLDEWSTAMLGTGSGSANSNSGNMNHGNMNHSGSGTMNQSSGTMNHGSGGMDHGSMNHDAMQGNMQQTGMDHDAMMKQMYDVFTVNGKTGDQIQALDIKPGERVKLRFVNVGYQTHKLHLPGQPFKITHTDGQPLAAPAEITDQLLAIAPGERYDIEFVAGDSGFVIDNHNDSAYAKDMRIPVKLQGSSKVNDPKDSADTNMASVNMAAYAKAGGKLIDRKPTVEYTMNLNNEEQHGGETKFTINSKTFPNTDPLPVKKGDVVKVKLKNIGTADHPMHLHGHFFQVIAKNGKLINPLVKDTLNVRPNEEYEVIFEADNEGNWVFHCHDLHHASGGMVTVVQYNGYKSNFTPDPSSANKPE